MPGGVAGERPMKAVPYADFFVVFTPTKRLALNGISAFFERLNIAF